jgi:hypothetical protein
VTQRNKWSRAPLNLYGTSQAWMCSTARAVVRDGKIVEYHVNVKIAFIVEPADIVK